MDVAEKFLKIAQNEQLVANANAELEEALYSKSEGGRTYYDWFWDNYQQNGNRISYQFCFAGGAWNDNTFTPKYDIVPNWSIVSMFVYSQITDLETALRRNGITLDTSNNANYSDVFAAGAFTVLPEIVFAKFTNSTYNTFANNYSLHTIRKITFCEGMSESVSHTSTFKNCTSLANVEFAGVVSSNIDLQWCPLTRESIESLFSILSNTVSGKTCTLNKSAKEAAFTDAEWQALIATKSNWTISLV